MTGLFFFYNFRSHKTRKLKKKNLMSRDFRVSSIGTPSENYFLLMLRFWEMKVYRKNGFNLIFRNHCFWPKTIDYRTQFFGQNCSFLFFLKNLSTPKSWFLKISWTFWLQESWFVYFFTIFGTGKTWKLKNLNRSKFSSSVKLGTFFKSLILEMVRLCTKKLVKTNGLYKISQNHGFFPKLWNIAHDFFASIPCPYFQTKTF